MPEQPVCGYEFNEDTRTMRVNCLGCVYGSSIEDFPSCMSRTIDKLIESKKAGSVIFAETREYEYDYPQVKMLLEIANIIEDISKTQKIFSPKNLVCEGCDKCANSRFNELQKIAIQTLRSDPIGAYVLISRLIRRMKTMANMTGSEKCARCCDHYIENSLEPFKRTLESATMIKMVKSKIAGHRIGDRTIYRDIFSPSIRPNFMFTKYIIDPPSKGEILDRYSVGDDVTVEIFKIPGETRKLYHVVPPEFRLSEEKYTLLDAARRYMAAHKPREAEFTARVREVFYNIGKDMLSELSGEMGIKLSTPELEQLAKILTRYTAGFGILEVILADERMQDIYINSPVGRIPICIFHRDFEECISNLIPTMRDAEVWATRFRLMSGRPLDEANPVLDTGIEVPGGRARVCVITSSLSPEGLGFAFRRHRDKPWTLPLFIQQKYITPLAAGLLSFLIDGGRTLLIAGGRSSGKTSLMGACMLEIMQKYRIITVEDTLELPISQMRDMGFNAERLKSRSVITKVEIEMPADEALRTALRLGDSCLIVGEVRSLEAKSLYEAMRIGALANVVAGTIHGENPYGVFDRVVNDLGVPLTSFKATDMIVVCNLLKSADGMHRFRRAIQLTEVRKHWKEDPLSEGGFVDLMYYSAKDDKLKPSSTFLEGESYVLNDTARRVREWAGRWDVIWDNINLRGSIKKALADYSTKYNVPQIVEGEFVVRSNAMTNIINERLKEETGSIESPEVFREWDMWAKGEIKKILRGEK